MLQAAEAAEKFAPNPRDRDDERSCRRRRCRRRSIPPGLCSCCATRKLLQGAEHEGLRTSRQSSASGYSYLGRAAAAAAGSDLDRALEILGLIGPGVDADRARLLVAYELADRDRATAVRMVNEISESDLWIKAEALLLGRRSDRSARQTASDGPDRPRVGTLSRCSAGRPRRRRRRPAGGSHAHRPGRPYGWLPRHAQRDRPHAGSAHLTSAEEPSLARRISSTISVAAWRWSIRKSRENCWSLSNHMRG